MTYKYIAKNVANFMFLTITMLIIVVSRKIFSVNLATKAKTFKHTYMCVSNILN